MLDLAPTAPIYPIAPSRPNTLSSLCAYRIASRQIPHVVIPSCHAPAPTRSPRTLDIYMPTSLRNLTLRSCLLSIAIVCTQTAYAPAEPPLSISSLPGVNDPAYFAASELLHPNASIPNLHITKHVVQIADADVATLLQSHGIFPSPEVYNILNTLNPDVGFSRDTTLPLTSAIWLPTTDAPAWQRLLRQRQIANRG